MSSRSARIFSAALTSALVCVIVLGPPFSSAAMAVEFWPLFKKPAPEPRFYPVHVIPHDAHARATGYAVPTYNWGYFGARRAPTCIANRHTGYYHNYVQWSWRPRY